MYPIYEPSEDSYLLSNVLEKKIPRMIHENPNLKILEIGVGSGIQLEKLKKIGVKKLLGVDINLNSVNLCRRKNFKVFESDLFSNIKEKFDIIIFNPPYLPKDKREDKKSSLATSGGKNGGEIINRFLIQAKKHLNKDGKIFLLISSLTKKISWKNYKKKLVGEKKLFFEKLEVWELFI